MLFRWEWSKSQVSLVSFGKLSLWFLYSFFIILGCSDLQSALRLRSSSNYILIIAMLSFLYWSSFLVLSIRGADSLFQRVRFDFVQWLWRRCNLSRWDPSVNLTSYVSLFYLPSLSCWLSASVVVICFFWYSSPCWLSLLFVFSNSFVWHILWS